MLRPGAVLGQKYELGRLLGTGGMGQVFEARNRNTGRRVAIKTLHANRNDSPEIVQRFLAEARTATIVEHPNVVEVLDLDHDEALGIPYIVQEFLDGETLAERIVAAPGERLTPDEALRIAVPIMRALDVAHARGVVHRDLKPGNIFLERCADGETRPKVIDFGIAKLLANQVEGKDYTRTGDTMGTPAYMSPEQAENSKSTDARADVWSMGVVLYKMLSGALPHDATTFQQMLVQVMREQPTPLRRRAPSLPNDVIAVVDRALRRDRNERFPSMREMLTATMSCTAWQESAALSPTRGSQPPREPANSRDFYPAGWVQTLTNPAGSAALQLHPEPSQPSAMNAAPKEPHSWQSEAALNSRMNATDVETTVTDASPRGAREVAVMISPPTRDHGSGVRGSGDAPLPMPPLVNGPNAEFVGQPSSVRRMTPAVAGLILGAALLGVMGVVLVQRSSPTAQRAAPQIVTVVSTRAPDVTPPTATPVREEAPSLPVQRPEVPPLRAHPDTVSRLGSRPVMRPAAPYAIPTTAGGPSRSPHRRGPTRADVGGVNATASDGPLRPSPSRLPDYNE